MEPVILHARSGFELRADLDVPWTADQIVALAGHGLWKALPADEFDALLKCHDDAENRVDNALNALLKERDELFHQVKVLTQTLNDTVNHLDKALRGEEP